MKDILVRDSEIANVNSFGARFSRLWAGSPRSFRIGFTILVFWIVVAIVGPFIAPFGPTQIGTGIPLSGISWVHPFGIDHISCCIYQFLQHCVD